MQKISLNSKQKGSMILSMSIAMVVAGILAVGSARIATTTFREAKGMVMGNQLQTLATALTSYISANTPTLIAAANATTGLVPAASMPTVTSLRDTSLLPVGTSLTPAYGGAYVLAIEVTPHGCTSPTPCTVIGNIHLSTPFLYDNGTAVDLALLGSAANAPKTNQIGFSTAVTPALIRMPGSTTYTNPDSTARAGILYATTLSTASVAAASGTQYWLQSQANLAALPTTGNILGDGRLAQDTMKPYMWTGTAWNELFSYGTSGSSVSIGNSSGTNGSSLSNTFVGNGAGKILTSSQNTAIGAGTLAATTTGGNNTATGSFALYSNTTGNSNVANGYLSLFTSTTASNNTAIGNESMSWNVDGSSNSALGHQSLLKNQNGTDNVAVGYQSLWSNTVSGNTAVGSRSLYSNTTGTSNTANGFEALKYNQNGGNNTGIGNMSLSNNKSGSRNTAIGSYSLYYGIGNSDNTAIGSNALVTNSNGSSNTAIGSDALLSNTWGNRNIAIGYQSLKGTQNGTDSIGIGVGTLASDPWSQYDVAIGNYALEKKGTGGTSSSSNTAIGYAALQNTTSGGSNTAIGFRAGSSITTAINSTAIGLNADVGNASNTIRLGNSAITSIGGAVGWTATSDSRLKSNIKTADRGLSFINKLRPVEYNLTASPDKLRTGFIAQEVEKADPSFSGVDSPAKSGDQFYRLTYTEFIPSMVKAIQELDAKASATVSANLQSTVSLLTLAVGVLGGIVLLLIGCVAVMWRRINTVVAAVASVGATA